MMAASGREDLMVVGSGSLARALCYSIAVSAPLAARVVVVARDPRRAAELCHVAAMRANLSGRSVTFTPLCIDMASLAALRDSVRFHRPSSVIICASDHSPWEPDTAPSAWTDLLSRAGFGITLAFQAKLAIAVGTVLRENHDEAFMLNACFPDAVNPLLSALDIPVLAGVGNAAVLANALQASAQLNQQADVQLLAHHFHLHTPADPSQEALAWCRGVPTPVAEHLTRQRAISRHEANQITGHHAALLLLSLIAGASVETNLPGPRGLPGGYPVRISAGQAMLRLPASVTETEAVALNQKWAALDGVVVRRDGVSFGPAAVACLSRDLPEFAPGFAIQDLHRATTALARLRETLRKRPSANSVNTPRPSLTQAI